MELQLIKGSFTPAEAVDLLTQMVHVKIKFHEDKIEKSLAEEDIKMREKRIKELQQDLNKVRQAIMSKETACGIEALITIS